MSITKLALKFALPLPQLESYQRFLFVGPHPDDIEIGAGATAAKLAALGKTVCFLICTDGRFGTGNLPTEEKEQIIPIRRREAEASARCLGIENLRFLDFSDGGRYELSELFQGVGKVISGFQPDVVFAPDPCVTSECHTDHLNVGNTVKSLACFAPYGELMSAYGLSAAPVKAVAFYMTAKPNVYVNTSGFFQRQLKSIFDCHLSQFPSGSDEAKALELYLKLRAADYGIRKFCRCAEGFHVLDSSRMHCLPEAGNE